MKSQLTWDRAQRYIGTNQKGHTNFFDTSIKGGGLDSAGSPMEAVLQAAAACTAMDVMNILTKQRKTVQSFTIDLDAERSDSDPRVFTKIAMLVHLMSPDVTIRDLERAITLSWDKYCSVSVMLKRAGVEMSWKAVVTSPALTVEHAENVH
jgi:putative redox protein